MAHSRFWSLAVCLAAAVVVTPGSAAGAAGCSSAPGGGLTLANVAAAGGVVRAVGSNGLIASSRSLGTWRVEPTPIVHNLRGIAWTGSRWVAVGDIGSILYLRGGRWHAVLHLPNSGLRAIAARGGLIAAAGSGGVLLTSRDDGLSWQTLASGTTDLLWGAARVGGSLVISGQESTLIASSDGMSWHPVAAAPLPTGNPIAPRPLLWQLAAAGSEVVAVGDFGAILEGTLAGGLRGVSSPTSEILRGVATDGRRWVAVGSGGTTLRSSDGRSWNAVRSPTSVDLRGVAWTGRRFVAVGDQSTVISSADGRHWRNNVTAMPCALLGLARSDGRLVAVGGGGRVEIADSVGHWREIHHPTRQDLYGVAGGPRGLVAVGAQGLVLSSADGTRWVTRRSPVRLNLHTVAWSGSQYLAGGDRGEVISSVDGRRWSRVRFPGFHSVRSFASGRDVVIAAGAGTIARRPMAGGAWVLQSTGFGRFQTGVAFGRGHFVIVGHNGELLVSTNGGLTWTAVAGGVTQNLDAVSWTGHRFVAVGERAAIASLDGTSWQRISDPGRRSLRAVVPWHRGAIAVGDLGTRVTIAG